jgi:hypothetical protein
MYTLERELAPSCFCQHIPVTKFQKCHQADGSVITAFLWRINKHKQANEQRKEGRKEGKKDYLNT